MNRDRIETLRTRIGALEASLAAEKARQQRANAKVAAREYSTIGEALCKYAGQSPDFKLMLKQVLASAVTDDSRIKFLTTRGWL
jgi:hypothetical protein